MAETTQSETETPTGAGESGLPPTRLDPLELVLLLRFGADPTPSVLALDDATPQAGLAFEAVDVRRLAVTDLTEALAATEPALGAEPDAYDYAILSAETLARAADPVPLLGGLEPICQRGVIVAPPGDCIAAGAHVDPELWQALSLDWDDGPPHLLLLAHRRPSDGFDGELPRDSAEAARLALAEARIKRLTGDLGGVMSVAMRESVQRRRADRELERMRSWPLARRIYNNAGFSILQRSVMQRRRGGIPPQVSERPIFFVVGRGKSGTSWLMRALDEHPEVLCKGEGRFFGGTTQVGRVDGRSMFAALLSSPELREWAFKSAWTRGADFAEEMESITGAAVERLLRSRAAAEGKVIAGDKTPLYGQGEVIAQIARACPGARVIHIIRDGRDVAVSAVHHVWNRPDRGGKELNSEFTAKRDRYRTGEIDPEADAESIFPPDFLENAAQRWATITRETVAEGKRLLGEGYMEIRYEDMLDDAGAELTRAFTLLGADTSPEIVDRCAERTSFERMSRGRSGRRKARTRGSEDSSSFFRKGVAGDWKNAFTSADREIYKRVAGDLLIDLGYESGLDW